MGGQVQHFTNLQETRLTPPAERPLLELGDDVLDKVFLEELGQGLLPILTDHTQ